MIHDMVFSDPMSGHDSPYKKLGLEGFHWLESINLSFWAHFDTQKQSDQVPICIDISREAFCIGIEANRTSKELFPPFFVK